MDSHGVPPVLEENEEQFSLQVHWTLEYLVFVDSFSIFRDTQFTEVLNFLLLRNLNFKDNTLFTVTLHLIHFVSDYSIRRQRVAQ